MNFDSNRIPLVVVVGPTASGKTGLSIELAKILDGEIISADSMQVYKGMNIGTAKPTKEEMQGVKHHLIDFLDPSQMFSVADYVRLARECIKDIWCRGKVPILVGGTGLYIDSLINNIDFCEEGVDLTLRDSLKERASKQGVESLLDELKEFDPVSAETLHPNNVKRIIRAIEVYKTTGMTITEHNELSKNAQSPYDTIIIGLNYNDRKILYNRINYRVDKMIEQGLLEEAREVLNSPWSTTAMGAIGYKELAPFFESGRTLEESLDKLKQSTRRYAKRQLTWFKRNENIHWVYVDQYKSFQALIQKALGIINNSGLFNVNY